MSKIHFVENFVTLFQNVFKLQDITFSLFQTCWDTLYYEAYILKRETMQKNTRFFGLFSPFHFLYYQQEYSSQYIIISSLASFTFNQLAWILVRYKILFCIILLEKKVPSCIFGVRKNWEKSIMHLLFLLLCASQNCSVQ